VGRIRGDVSEFFPVLHATLAEVKALALGYGGETTRSVEDIGNVMEAALNKVCGRLGSGGDT
jgi:hypothetical protein